MPRRKSESEDTERFEFAKLPTVADLEAEDKQQVVNLLETLDTLTGEQEALDERVEIAKAELEALQQRLGRPGFRYGALCFVNQQVKGRKTLDKMLLLENGCPAQVLNDSYKTGQPYSRNMFKRLEE